MKNAFILKTAIFVIVFSTISGCDKTGDEQRFFEDVTISSGLLSSGMTYGASWGDFNGDKLPDLYTTNHGNPAVLYKNLGGGHFENVTDQFFSADELEGDKHGATWADYDNDGDQDLLLLRGGGRGIGVGPNSYYVNSGSSFENRAVEAGLDNPFARTRMQMLYDFNNDGFLDVFLGALAREDGKAPAAIFVQKNGRFEQSELSRAFATPSIPFCVLALLDTVDEDMGMICRVQGASDRAAHVFNLKNNTLQELNLMPKTHFDDVAVGDFDGDLKSDIYLARKSIASPVLFGRHGSNNIVLDFKIGRKHASEALSAEFRTSGEVTVEALSAPTADLLSSDRVFIGKKGLHPNQTTFVLNRNIPGIDKQISFTPGKQIGAYIERAEGDVWRLTVSSDAARAADKSEEPVQMTFRISSTEMIGQVTSDGMELDEGIAPDRLLMSRAGKYSEESDKRGINDSSSNSANVVAGDFDNDMDLDLYVVASSNMQNHENRLLLNNGKGEFVPVSGAGGAPGTPAGVGDAVAMADYDQDGFLDLLVTNGGSMGRSYGLASKDGGYQLYHNAGNRNHWLEIDLEGVKSNHDGIGAVVYVTSGDVTQVRIQDGGVHSRAQNFQRLHFGLARNGMVEKIMIRWPSGVVQKLENVAVDQLLHIIETES